MTAVRREVEALHDSLRRIGMVRNGQGLYVRGRGVSGAVYQGVLAKAAKHELETLAGIVERLDKATAPKGRPHLWVPTKGTVARTVLDVLYVNALAHDHPHVTMLTGLTDSELAVRIEGAGINSVRPRRVELTRAGWVEVAGQTGAETRWTLTFQGRRKLEEVMAGE